MTWEITRGRRRRVSVSQAERSIWIKAAAMTSIVMMLMLLHPSYGQSVAPNLDNLLYASYCVGVLNDAMEVSSPEKFDETECEKNSKAEVCSAFHAFLQSNMNDLLNRRNRFSAYVLAATDMLDTASLNALQIAIKRGNIDATRCRTNPGYIQCVKRCTDARNAQCLTSCTSSVPECVRQDRCFH